MTIDTTEAAVRNAHGGFSFLRDAFIGEPTQVIEVVVDDEVDTDVPSRELVRVEVIPSPPVTRRTWRQRLSGVLRAAKAALACVREAVGWLAASVVRDAQRRSYSGRHRTVDLGSHRIKRTILGRERSTSEFSGVVQQRCREAAAQEGELVFQPGDTFIDWLTVAHDSMRYLNYVRKHTPTHGRWACS